MIWCIRSAIMSILFSLAHFTISDTNPDGLAAFHTLSCWSILLSHDADFVPLPVERCTALSVPALEKLTLFHVNSVFKGFSYYLSLSKMCANTEFFWSIFSRIWTEYGDLFHWSPYSVQMRKNTDQKNSVFGRYSCSLSQAIFSSSSVNGNRPLQFSSYKFSVTFQ